MSISLLAKHLNEYISGRKIVERVVKPSEPTYPVPKGWNFSSEVGKTCCGVNIEEEFCKNVIPLGI